MKTQLLHTLSSKQNKTAFAVALSLLSGLIIGFAFASFFFVSNTLSDGQEREWREINDKYPFIGALLDSERASESQDSRYLMLKDKLNQYIKDSERRGWQTDVAVYVRDLSNGPWIGINQDVDFSPASLLKLPVIMAIYKKAEEEDRPILSRKITMPPVNTNLIQQIKSTASIRPGETYTVRELIEAVLVSSDNNAFQALLLELKDEITLEKAFSDIGLKYQAIDSMGDVTTTMKSYTSLFRILYNATYLSRASSNAILEYMSKSTFKEGVVGKLPKNVVVSHKFGERSFSNAPLNQQLHDCGIIYIKHGPYVLCVMSKGDNQTEMKTAIQDISLIVFNQLQNP